MKYCVPCRKDALPLSSQEIAEKLKILDGWELSGDSNAIKKKWKFRNFSEAFGFVNRVGELAEAEDHHPDIAFGWGYAEIIFTTHSIGGLHANDFVMAVEVEKLF